MQYKVKPGANDPKVIIRLKKKLLSLSEIVKEKHVDEALYLALFLYSIDEVRQADELVSGVIESFDTDEDLWFYIKDAYLLKWSIFLRDSDLQAADKIQKRVVAAEFDLDLDNTNNSEIYERYKKRMGLLPEALDAVELERNEWFHCSMLGQEALDSHQYLLFYPYFEGCVPASFQSEIASHVDDMYSRLAKALKSF